jgi:cobaltochelatase CobN
MHLLAAQPGTVVTDEPVDLAQSAGAIVVLSAADSELALIAGARAELGTGFPSVRLANLMQLRHHVSVDLYLEKVLARAKLVIVRLLGGASYWPYGVEQIAALAQAGVRVVFLPGDDKPDPALTERGSLDAAAVERLWRYLVHGGRSNARAFLGFAATLIGHDAPAPEPVPLARAGLYWPGVALADLAAWRAHVGAEGPVAAIVFYRALVQAGDVAPIDALVAALAARGLRPLPVFAQSLKDPIAGGFVGTTLAEAGADLVLNTTAFALGTGAEAGARPTPPFDAVTGPILQVVLAGGTAEAWRAGTRGLAPQDVAMNVALPELDGRVLTRAISFKAPRAVDALTECAIVAHEPVPDRVAFVADLAAAWARLGRTPAPERRIAIVLANYPNRDGRVANGVGLDTPASVAHALGALADAGFRIAGRPQDGAALMADLLAGPTNARRGGIERESLSLADYTAFLTGVPAAARAAVLARWGAPETDPFFRPEAAACGRFALPVVRYGNVVVAIQPARGYNIDPTATYHDPALPPPHGYLAFYAWLRHGFGAHAIVHFGKHGNLEWLPGKALALSDACFPEVALGPLPQLYPFIVNDPGEGSQAKRRAAAVVVDHLTPPLTRAGTYGPLAELERLIDEYYDAAALDARRLPGLARDILERTRGTGLDRDVGIVAEDDEGRALAKLDAYLCEIKEMQIRDGLHVFGRAPAGGWLDDLLVALARVPRGTGEGADASVTRALAADLGLDLDPLDADMAAAWAGPRPAILGPAEGWRSAGDTVERLEELARRLVAGEVPLDPAWTRTAPVAAWLAARARPAVLACAGAETDALLAGLAGRFVAPGPSGAPTRGRPEVLPTGRNFFSVDTRAVPTPAAWRLGWHAAGLIVTRHFQDTGQWLRRAALSAWGTANMRTGGDDVAQALALMGARPTWEPRTGRVTGFEILPLSLLGRPRVDVTLRVSGFFRDAFANLIDLVDAAARAIAGLDESEADNPLAARVRAEVDELVRGGLGADAARRRAGARVFGSRPGAYGAGLQALIDERLWTTRADFARAYLTWGGFAYGGGREGEAAHGDLERRLGQVEAVLHNQDNREHDLLDSDDYYQFEGGLAAAVATLAGAEPALYHNDTSRPETPRVRTLRDEIGRVVRARVVNPKWIAGVLRHGYKGAAELAATVDYMFAFAATARVVDDRHFDAVFEAYLRDADVLAFLRGANPAALAEMAARLDEAIARGLWRPRANATHRVLAALKAGRDPDAEEAA